MAPSVLGFERVLMTGAAGAIGSTLRAGLSGLYPTLRLTDIRPMTAGPGEEFMQADLSDLDAARRVMDGVNAVIHLAGIPDEAGFEAILRHNIVTTYSVLQAAREAGARRVVYASSNHAVGFQPLGVNESVLPRPDSFYGAAKVHSEALGSLYFDKFGLEFAALRIGSFLDRPTRRRHLATWLSPRDAVNLTRACLEAPRVGFSILYGISGNTRSAFDNRSAFALGYHPQDDAETYAAEIEAQPGNEREEARDATFVGGPFTDHLERGA